MTTKPDPTTTPPPSQGGAEASEAPTGEGGGGVTRGRPGRRTLADRKEAVLQVLMGKASIDQVATRLGVYPKTVEMWRDQAVAGMTEALLRGDVGTERERELERENAELRETLADVSVKYAIAQKGIAEWKAASRPTKPARSRR